MTCRYQSSGGGKVANWTGGSGAVSSHQNCHSISVRSKWGEEDCASGDLDTKLVAYKHHFKEPAPCSQAWVLHFLWPLICWVILWCHSMVSTSGAERARFSNNLFTRCYSIMVLSIANMSLLLSSSGPYSRLLGFLTIESEVLYIADCNQHI